MSENKKVLFIINKYAGTGYQSSVEGKILNQCEVAQLEPTIEYTQGPNHATLLARSAADQKNFDIIYAVGGDGTVNEVAQGLVHSEQAMGIIPKGSGNGLARHLGIPMNFTKSLEHLTNHSIIRMDSFLVNGKLSVNVSGIGFDGHIASLFAHQTKRGLIGYSKLILKEFLSFKEFSADIIIDDKPKIKNAFVLAFANSSQFGNNARISPHASVSDGWLDVCTIRKVSILNVIGFTQKMFSGTIDKSSLVDIEKGKQIKLSFPVPMPYHIDGEGMPPATDFTITMQPSSLSLAIPLANKRPI